MDRIEEIVRSTLPVGFEPRKERDKRPTDGELAIMFHGGDYKLIYDPGNRDEVEVARDSFKKLKAKGFAAFKAVGDKGDKGEQILEFDEKVGRIIMAPPLRGGR
jgi:hypothetical protein